jgi:hypothetical protein
MCASAGKLVEMERPYIRKSDGSVRQGSAVVPGENRELRLSPGDLSFIRIDHQTRLQFGSTEVVIECPFTLAREGVVHELDPEQRRDLGPLLQLYPDRLDSATVNDEATLRLEFASGASIIVPQDFHYEAWQVNGPGTYLIVCMPGADGKLAVWD